MSTTAVMNTRANAIIHEGWNVLVEQLGIQRATQFVVLLERGRGDSVKEIADYWGATSIDNIYAEVMSWKTRQQCSQPVGYPSGV